MVMLEIYKGSALILISFWCNVSVVISSYWTISNHIPNDYLRYLILSLYALHKHDRVQIYLQWLFTPPNFCCAKFQTYIKIKMPRIVQWTPIFPSHRLVVAICHIYVLSLSLSLCIYMYTQIYTAFSWTVRKYIIDFRAHDTSKFLSMYSLWKRADFYIIIMQSKFNINRILL